MTENEVAKQIVDAAYRVHTSLGPGLLESVYCGYRLLLASNSQQTVTAEVVLAYELEKRSLRVVRQQPVPIVYQGTRIEIGFRADLIVEDLVIVEIKSVEVVAPVHKKQLLTHLRLADKAAHKLQRGPHQGRHHSDRKRHAGLISRKDAKAQRYPSGLRLSARNQYASSV